MLFCMKIDIGISEKNRKQIAEGLCRVLADSYTLYLKTHNFHWNVTGPQFRSLHLMFEEQYNELATAVDTIAERIRALGEYAPGSYEDYKKLSSFTIEPGVPNDIEMIKQLVHGHESVVRTSREVFPVMEEAHDEASKDLLTQRIQLHEKTAWMLRSLVEKPSHSH